MRRGGADPQRGLRSTGRSSSTSSKRQFSSPGIQICRRRLSSVAVNFVRSMQRNNKPTCASASIGDRSPGNAICAPPCCFTHRQYPVKPVFFRGRHSVPQYRRDLAGIAEGECTESACHRWSLSLCRTDRNRADSRPKGARPMALPAGHAACAAGDTPVRTPARAAARIMSLAFSAIMITVALVLPDTTVGMTEASTTRSPSRPRTRN